jgi:hypothetical protein
MEMNASRVPHAEAINTKGWHFGFEKLDAAISEAVSGALENSFELDPPDVNLPVSWETEDGIGGPPAADPLTVYVSLPVFSAGLDTGPVWSASLSGMIDELIESHKEDGRVGKDSVPLLEKLRDALLSEARKIDKEINRAQRG